MVQEIGDCEGGSIGAGGICSASRVGARGCAGIGSSPWD